MRTLYTDTCSPDFHSWDFDLRDFHTIGGFPLSFKDYLYELFTRYFIEHDTYKDNEDRGLLERYMSIFGYELDFEVVDKIECYLKIIDAQVCEEKYLVHISDELGNPPDIFRDAQIYRNLLSYVVSIYKIKGTLGAYQLFFSILGYGVNITELPLISREHLYDNKGEYDTGQDLALYDQNRCNTCSEYEIEFYPLGGMAILEPDILEKLWAVVYFNEPINAKLKSFTSVFSIRDNMEININEDMVSTIETLKTYDPLGGELEYDDEENYDDVFNFGGTPRIIEAQVKTENNNILADITIRFENILISETLETETDFQAIYYNSFGTQIYTRGGELRDVIWGNGGEYLAKIGDNPNSPNTSQYSFMRIIGKMVTTPEPGGPKEVGYLDITLGPGREEIGNIYML